MGPFEWSGALFVLVNLGLGIGFGVALDRSGFGDSRRIAGQFMLTDLTVLKVMFTAILVAMLLLLWSSALGFVDLDRVAIGETFLNSAIAGGVLLGAGMVIGGYCPGTSLVASSTLKLDGFVFIFGLFVGIFAFGESVPRFWTFFQESGAMGSYAIDDWLGMSKGMAGLLVTLLALGAFWGVAKFEAARGTGSGPTPGLRLGSGLALVASLGLVVMPQPGLDARIQRMAPELAELVAQREVQIDPAELVDLMHNNQVKLVLLDLRRESDFNMFHLLDAKHVTLDDLRGDMPDSIDPIAIVITMSNDEVRATEAFEILRARGLAGSYILEGGINAWLEIYGGLSRLEPTPVSDPAGDAREPLRYTFPAALGDRLDIAWPDPYHLDLPEREYTKKARSMAPLILAGGGCG